MLGQFDTGLLFKELILVLKVCLKFLICLFLLNSKTVKWSFCSYMRFTERERKAIKGKQKKKGGGEEKEESQVRRGEILTYMCVSVCFHLL